MRTIRGCVTGHYVSHAFHGQHIHEIAHISHYNHIPQPVIQYTHPVPEPNNQWFTPIQSLGHAAASWYRASPLQLRLASHHPQHLLQSVSIAPQDGLCKRLQLGLPSERSPARREGHVVGHSARLVLQICEHWLRRAPESLGRFICILAS